MTFVALLTGRFAGTIDDAVVQLKHKHLLRRISLWSETSVTFVHKFQRLCDLHCSKHKANSGVLDRHHDACGKFFPFGLRSILLFVVLAHGRAGLYPPDFSWSTIELLLKVSQNSSFPRLGWSGRDLRRLLAICLMLWTPLHCLVPVCLMSAALARNMLGFR